MTDNGQTKPVRFLNAQSYICYHQASDRNVGYETHYLCVCACVHACIKEMQLMIKERQSMTSKMQSMIK
jgi:hypothetical protein